MRYVTDVSIDVVVAFDISFNESLTICAFGIGVSYFGRSREYELIISREFEDQFYFVARADSAYYGAAETIVLHGIYSYAMQELDETN